MDKSMNRILSWIVLAAGGALFCAAELSAAQRTFVSAANGNDANPCSRPFPCRNFTAAIPQTDVDGEVIVLDSGGYGAVTIPQPIALISPTGVHAAITAFSGNAVTVNAGDTAHVVLRNLSLNSQGANYGVKTDTAATLHVENCVISGFGFYGIFFAPTTSDARLYVSDSLVRRSGDSGIAIIGGTGIRGTLDSVQLHKNLTGVYVDTAEGTIRDSVASGGTTGFWTYNSKVMIENTASSSNALGFYAGVGSVMIMTRCAAASNTTYGVAATPGTIYVSGSTIVSNGTGVSGAGGGTALSRGNNTLQANTTNGAFTSTFAPN
jgi:parallel beta helix pectate lyase-like protein